MTNTDIEQSARAIGQAGSPAFTHHAGATLERLSELAKQGDLEGLSTTLLAHVGLHPSDRRKLVDSVPAKVLNQYIYIYRKRSVTAVERWRERTPDWADTLKRAIDDPAIFAAAARDMADAVGSAELG
jgi:hypothetical protein